MAEDNFSMLEKVNTTFEAVTIRSSQLTEPSNHEDENGAIYMMSLDQSASFRLNGQKIKLYTALKYLWLWFDGKPTFKKQRKLRGSSRA